MIAWLGVVDVRRMWWHEPPPGTSTTDAHLLHVACATRLNEHTRPLSICSDDDVDDMATRETPPTCEDDCRSRSPTVLGSPMTLQSEGSASTPEIDTPTDAPPADMHDARLSRGLQWLSNADAPREMERPAGASAADIQCAQEAEKARLRVWLATILDVS